MVTNTEPVLQWLDARKKMLDLIKARVREHSEAGFLVERCRQYDWMLREQVLTESLGVKADMQAERKSGCFCR
ncbi:MAG: hypothetical protein KAV87_46515 [Desulfobacteraceae bacterium]|nr:hypothetical protein [Desulfobacteraceae bacterium]